MPNYESHPQIRRSSTPPTILQTIKSELIKQPMANFGPEKFAERDGYAEQFIKEILLRKNDKKVKGLNSTQLRKIFHQVKHLEQKFRSKKPEDKIERAEIALLSAQLAYASGRDLIPDDFFDLVTFCLKPERCSTKADFDNVAKFLETLMAYHKYYSSQTSQPGGDND